MIEIKQADLRDLPELQEIGIRSYVPHYTHLWREGGVEWYLERCFGEKSLSADLANENIEYYFITAENFHVGILKLVLQQALPDSAIENALYLEKIYLIKEWTGKAAGRRAMEFTFDRARELKRECVWLMAMDTSDKPIAAYRRAGFIEHSRTRLDFDLMKKEFRGMVVLKNCLNNNDN